MGGSSSKPERNEALALCRLRLRFIKQAVDLRYALSAAHLAYTQSLRSVGIALRRFVEAEVSIESSLSTSEPDKSPSHSSYASPSPSRLVEAGCSPLHGGSPLSPCPPKVSYMRTSCSAAVAVRMDPRTNSVVEEEEALSFPLPPPPLPRTASWDFFDPVDSMDSVGGFQDGQQLYSPTLGSSAGFRPFKEDEVVPLDDDEVQWGKGGSKGKKEQGNFPVSQDRNEVFHSHSLNGITLEKFPDVQQAQSGEQNVLKSDHSNVNGSTESLASIVPSDLCSVKQGSADQPKELCSEREDASDFITHRAKDLLSSIKDIEYRFLKAAEHGSEVSRMLEAKKVRLSSVSQKKGSSSPSVFLSILYAACCKKATDRSHEPIQHVTKVITWNRSTSSLSSSSKNPLAAAAAKDDICDSGSDFIDEVCMISGSHSSTLDRLYAWERKLHDEVKASESIRKEYDRKCSQLRHEFAKDLSARVIDKTRAAIKDLHSQVRVAIQAVDSISKRIEKLRDEELLPQLLELIQGLSRMWKSMLECHHSQYITITLAYHARSSVAPSQNETYKQALIHLQNELDFFRSSFANWIESQTAYVGALNIWLQNCILLPQERSRGRRAAVFSPRRALAPPIFVLCRDWLAAIRSLPSEELSDAIRALVSDLRDCFDKQTEEKQAESSLKQLENEEQLHSKEAENYDKASSLGVLQPNLTRVFDSLSKFAEASLKAYEDVKQGSEVARVAYTNARMRFVI
uniref:Protein transport protein SEC31 n=1 Tax=Anthurium amnicola TaxID=1678845 RepID=A0A1D1XI52_9ARAE